MIPTSFPTANSHRLVHFLPDHRPTDFSRLEDIAADAILHARTALALQPGLSDPAAAAMRAAMTQLALQVSGRDLFADEARDALAEIVAECEQRLQAEGDDSVLEAIQTQAQAALDASHRVSDLLAAERSIRRARAISA